MKIYKGYVDNDIMCQVEVWEDDKLLGPLKHHQLHSPDGFAWGYGGSGPSELARCLLLDASGHDTLYQEFKWAYVAKWIGEWEISQKEILDWMVANGAFVW